jgi:hypothetical protein
MSKPQLPPITAKSPTLDKIMALVKVEAAIVATQMVEEIGLGTLHSTEFLVQLRIYQKQLKEYITIPPEE